MTKALHQNRFLISFGILSLLILTLVFLGKSNLFSENSSLGSFAITFDLLITAPVLYYLFIRKTAIPKTTVVPVLIACIAIGTYSLPAENQAYLDLFKIWCLPLIELMILTFIIWKIRTSIRRYKEKKQSNPDFFSTLKETCSEILPEKMVPFFATEIAVLYYGFFRWKKPLLHEHDFTYHKNSGTPTLLVAVIIIVAVETFAVHLLVASWSPTLAWILLILSVYTALQLVGFLKSLSQRPISVQPDVVKFRYGILAETEIKLEDIACVELSKGDFPSDASIRKLSPLGELESHNVIIRLTKEYSLASMYGFKKKFTNLALHVDQREEFKRRVDSAIEQLKETPEESESTLHF